ncbi:MAG: hypothetical protein ABH824_05595 [Nanoarchaeota archaeon]|nr:hypothetical protein [Nanoarchaeota archaeon]MBU1632321.1 hypothetical protein [Nanoarchaeota archaeon]MBU1875880.1 hypothetical protein [Nanoarchaeota archaeon]
MAKKRGLKSSFSKEKLELHRLAHYAFFAGIALAIIIGIFHKVFDSLLGVEASRVYVTTFVFLGTIVGLFNLTAKETIPFLTAAVALMLAGIVNLNLVYGVGDVLRPSLSNIVVFVVPGAIIVGMKTIWRLASD